MRRALSFISLLGAACLLLLSSPAYAGLFDDTGAREQIAAVKQETAQQIDTLSKSQLDLATQIMGLREENLRLFGEIEVLRYENEQLKQRQMNLYLDLDSRLSRFEGGASAPSASSASPASSASAPAAQETRAANGMEESKAYENALNLFRASRYKEAATAFGGFLKAYPGSEMSPNAQFWLGSALYAQSKYKEAMEAQFALLREWPDSSRAPDAMLIIANCQRDEKNRAAEQRTLKDITAQYPGSSAATEAKRRLGAK